MQKNITKDISRCVIRHLFVYADISAAFVLSGNTIIVTSANEAKNVGNQTSAENGLNSKGRIERHTLDELLRETGTKRLQTHLFNKRAKQD